MSTPTSTLSFQPRRHPFEVDARYAWTLLRAGTFKLDAGSMFGLVPKVVWQKAATSGGAIDDKGRLIVSHNCLLLRRVDSNAAPVQSGEPKVILLECGSGDKLDSKMQGVFDLQPSAARPGRPRSIIDALQEVKVAPESVDAVVVSHLHFDHAGGLTRLCKPGETPTWPCPPNSDGGGGSSQTGGCVVTFPNAKIHVQQREWNDAIKNRSVMTKTYYPDHLWPIEDRLVLADSPRPFPSGYTPDRDEQPRTPVELRATLIAPGLSVFLTPGHTWGQQATMFRDAQGRTIVFCPDVMPTVHHVGAAYSLAYDVEPYTSMLSKRWLLAEAAEKGWILCLDHESGPPLVRVKDDGRGWFVLEPVAE